jgi:hypothetical protein
MNPKKGAEVGQFSVDARRSDILKVVIWGCKR